MDRAIFREQNCRLDFTTRINGPKIIQHVPRCIWLPMFERHPVQKYKVKAVKPITQN